MTRFLFGIALGMSLALAGVAEAKTVSIDFTGASPVSQGLMPVNNRDGAITKQFTHQTWHLADFPRLAGHEKGGADLRIDDAMDGPEFIATVTVSDEDPDFVHFPYAVNPITIDGKIDPGEWEGAYTVKLDRAQYDAAGDGADWAGPDDFSGSYSFKWDENALYVLGQVIDSTPLLNDQGGNPGGEYWDGDGMEQFIGVDDSNPER